MIAGNKFQKPLKTKYRKGEDFDVKEERRHKHHDKSYYRLLRQEQEEYQNFYGNQDDE